VALLEDRPKSVRPIADRSASLAPRVATSPRRSSASPAAWLLDLSSFHAEFTALWDALGPLPTDRRRTERHDSVHPGVERVLHSDRTALRTRAAEVWSASEPTVADAVARLDVSAPDDWAGAPEERHLGDWFRLVMAAHLTPVEPAAGIQDLRLGLPQLGFSHAEARRAVWGRELGDLAMALAPEAYGPAVSLSLGHGHKGWVGADDAARLQERLASVPPASFRSAQHLVRPCEALWQLLDPVVTTPGVALVLSSR
jgi:hypothetical protein